MGSRARIGTQGIAEGGGFPRGLGLLEDGGIAELHVEFHQHKAAKQEAFANDLFLKEAPGVVVMGRIVVGRVEEEIGVGG
jgi:hypothetical protein